MGEADNNTSGSSNTLSKSCFHSAVRTPLRGSESLNRRMRRNWVATLSKSSDFISAPGSASRTVARESMHFLMVLCFFISAAFSVARCSMLNFSVPSAIWLLLWSVLVCSDCFCLFW